MRSSFFILIFCCALLLCPLFAGVGQAANYVTLTPLASGNAQIERQADYIIQDKKNPLSLSQAWQSYQSGTAKVVRAGRDGYVHLGWGARSVWMVIPVLNQTDASDWHLKLADRAFMFQPFLKSLTVIQGETGLTLPSRLTADRKAIVSLPKRLPATLVVHLEFAGSGPVILKPSLSQAGESPPWSANWGRLAWIVAAAVGAATVAASLLPLQLPMILLGASGILYALWVGGDAWVHAPSGGFCAVLLLSLAGSLNILGCYLILRKQGISLRHARNATTELIMAAMGVAGLVVCAGVAAFLPGLGFAVGMIALMTGFLMSLMLLVQAQSYYHADVSWGLLALSIGLVGIVVTWPQAMGLQISNTALFPLAPIGVMVQTVVILLWALAWRFEESVRLRRNETEGDSESSRMMLRKTDVSTKLKASQETHDQERLLRVLEQERAQMEVLRDSERKKTEEMRQAKDSADEAIRAKSAFFAVLGHEIRTPMNGVLGMVKLLLKLNLSKDQRQYANTILESGEAMVTILNDMLDFEKIDSGKMTFEEITYDLPHILNSISTLMQGHAMAKGLDLILRIDPQTPKIVIGDPTRLRQVLLNLVSNAVKFTEKGQVVIQVQPLNTEDPKSRQVYFAVQDSGIGISRAAQRHLFNPFTQADASTARKFGGTGLGLAISQKLVTRMGGEINLNSREGEGTTFFFTLNMQIGSASDLAQTGGNAADIPLAAAPVGLPHTLPPLKILVVDDNTINQRVMSGFLSPGGHAIDMADTVASAWDFLTHPSHASYDAIFMDLELPDGNGADLTQRLRASGGQNSGTVIIGLTGHTDTDILASCRAAGMQDVLTKPVDPDTLQHTLFQLTQNAITPFVPIIPQGINGVNVTPQTRTPHAHAHDHDDEFGDGFNQTIAALPQATPLSPVSVPTADNVILFDPATLRPLRDTLGLDVVQSLLADLYATAEESITALNHAVANENWLEAQAKAHDLKGMAGNFGLKDLSDRAARIDAALRSGNRDGLAPDVAALGQTFAQSREALDTWLAA
ncbi:MAG: ATP-binding protein [Pseudomonadota bacterium]